MTGLDTSILVRYLTRDDSVQYEAARAVLEGCSPEAPGYVNVVVLCELVWVIDLLLTTRSLVIERCDAVRAALRDFAEGQAGFADSLIVRLNLEAGGADTETLDRRAAALPGMRRVTSDE